MLIEDLNFVRTPFDRRNFRAKVKFKTLKYMSQGSLEKEKSCSKIVNAKNGFGIHTTL